MIDFRDLVDETKIMEVAPRYFGLGFIQLTLGTGRYHFYCKDLDPTLDDEEVHNHRYNFRSTVLKGTLENQLFFVNEHVNGGFEVADVTCKPGLSGMPEIKIESAIIKPISTFVTTEGQSYNMFSETFHRVKALTPYTVTRLARGQYLKETAQVVRIKGAAFVCPFETNIGENECWDWIAKACKQ